MAVNYYWRVALLWMYAVGVASSQKTLHFSYITAKTGSFVSSGAIPVVDLALEQINNRTDILPNYNLSYTTILDSKCDDTASLDAFMTNFRGVSQPTYLSLLCCGCSTATIPVAEVSHYWNIPQMAGIAGAAVLNDRQKFRGFFRTLPSFEFVGPALAEIAREYMWTQMAIITQKESLFTLVAESLDSIFRSESRVLDTTATIDITTQQLFPYDLLFNWISLDITTCTIFPIRSTMDIRALISMDRDYRIIVINANPPLAHTVLCEAFHRGYFAPRYVYLTPSWYSNGWWRDDYGNASCTPEMMLKMLNNSLAYTPNGYFVLDDDTQRRSISGLTGEEFEAEYAARLGAERYRNLNLTDFILSGSVYDAMWAIAVGLHDASESVARNDSTGCDQQPGKLVSLEDFDYDNEKMGCMLRKSFSQVSFSGVTGDINFNSNGSRIENRVRFEQYLISGDSSIDRKTIAEVVVGNNDTRFVYAAGVDESQIWPDGVPYDGAARVELHTNDIGLEVVYSVTVFAGLMYTVVCLLFNTIFRKNKYVKLSSPKLNYLVITGAALLYMTVLFHVFSVEDQNYCLMQTILCNIRQWSFSLGYTLCFGVILAKTWRIYNIFSNPTPKKKIPKDWLLFLIVFLVVLVDLTIVFIGTAIPTVRLNATLVHDVQHPMSVDAEGITYNNQIFVCVNSNTIIWLAVSYAYKGLLQLVAIFMAFHTRRVKIKALNDSKEIAVIIYINSITLALLAVVEFALNTYHEVYATLFGLGLMVGATLFLTLVFVPRMVYVCRDPKGKAALDHSSSHKTPTNTAVTIKYVSKADAIDTNEVTVLKQRVTELETKLANMVVADCGSYT